MSDQIRVIHITAEHGAREVLTGTTLEEHQALVDGRVECIALSERIDLWCNDEGKLNNMPPVAAIHDSDGRLVDVIAGPCFIASHDDEGNTTGLDGALLDEARALVARHLTMISVGEG